MLYDEGALDAAWELVKDWTAEERQKLRDEVPRLGFKAAIRGRSVLDLARDSVALARQGLARRARLDREGDDETQYLEGLEGVVARGITPAEEMLEKYEGSWGRSVDPVFSEYAY